MAQKLLPGDPPVAITLRRSTRARRVSLRVSALDGRVTMSLPRGYPESEAMAFAEEKADWIRGHLAKHVDPAEVRLGSELLLEGAIVRVTPGKVRRAEQRGELLVVPDAPEMVGARVKAFLKLRAKARLTERAHHYAGLLGRKVSRVTLRDTRSRWGSCSSAGNLMFSWRLIMAPPEALDYVAAHEAAHLVEMNHSAAYWAQVRKIFPHFEPQRDWLRQNGAQLHRYRFGD